MFSILMRFRGALLIWIPSLPQGMEIRSMNDRMVRQSNPGLGQIVSVEADLTWSPDKLSGFFALLSRGFPVKARLPASLRSTLTQLGISPEFISDRIQAVFLDGIPTVDLDSQMVRPGSTVALSTAITEQYMAFTFITGRDYCEGQQAERTASRPVEDGNEHTLTLKLFNVLSRVLGPHFLEIGIPVRAEDLKDYLQSRPDQFWSGFKKGAIDGHEVDMEYLRGLSWLEDSGPVLLKVGTQA